MNWISVEKALPEKSGKYIVFIKRAGYTKGFFSVPDDSEVTTLNYATRHIFQRIEGTEAIYSIKNEWENPDVTHWMPLPKPPEDR